MLPISVIIITKNEAVNIGECITAARLLSNNIIVVDSGSADDTCDIAQRNEATVIKTDWKGFGFARNTAAENAAHDWILAIDADERITPLLVENIGKINFENDHIVYGFKRQNYFLGKKMRFGKWGKDKVYRLYNKQHTRWNLSLVHEVLEGNSLVKVLINGNINHYPVRKLAENYEKMYRYARLNANKHYADGKKATFIKRFLSPLSDFLQSYVVHLGFLDGKEGFIVSFSNAKYTWLKYQYLHEMNKKS